MVNTLEDIAAIIGASFDGDPSKVIYGINTLEDAQSNQISYATSIKYLKPLSLTRAGAVIFSVDGLKIQTICIDKTLFGIK